MERYTATHWRLLDAPKEVREVECLKVLYPALFRSIQPGDLWAGRLDFLPIGFGSVTSLGGVGHYCVFGKLRAFQQQLPEQERSRVDALYDYWLEHDLKTLYCRDVLTENTVGRFIDTEYPLIATARLSGMMLDYQKLMDLGIDGLEAEIRARLAEDADNPFLRSGLECLDLFRTCARHLAAQAEAQGLTRIRDGLLAVCHDKPRTFQEAMQLFWLYAMLAGVINYGRMDDVLGPYLARDLQEGRLTDQEAYDYVRCLWTMIENRRTTVNGRVIVGGRGRRHPKEADVFLRYAMRVCKDCRYVEPQFTLRFDKDTPEDVWDMALDAIEKPPGTLFADAGRFIFG